MIDFLYQTHVVFPKGLKKAVHYNILINPTGKPGKFRAVDWCVELNNLFTKVEYGGSSSNHTVDHIIKESPLVEAYRSIRTSIEQNFALSHLTSAHTDPDMTKTFDVLRQHLEHHKPHRRVLGCKSKYCIPDPIEKGMNLFLKENMVTGADGNRGEVGDNEDFEEAVNEIDIVGELLE
ncbi:hypothetical protein BDQ17DRAFT_1259648 [Cyathus striatus]|nr:hypothetical protein BDQ17DRAFT_1259648 [Cyathus striatus]